MSEALSKQNYEEIIRYLEGSPQEVDRATRILANDKFLYLQLEKTRSKKNVPGDLLEEIFNEGLAILVGNIRRGKFKKKSSLPTYFVGICKNLFLQKSKTNKPFLIGDENFFEERSPSVEEDFIEMENAKELQQLIRHSLALLGEKCQKVLEMVKLGFSMEVIAREMKWKYQTTRNNAGKCREKFRKLTTDNSNLYNRIKLLR